MRGEWEAATKHWPEVSHDDPSWSCQTSDWMQLLPESDSHRTPHPTPR